MHSTLQILTLLTLALRASAHGYLGSLSVSGTTYTGTGPGGSPSKTVIRPTKPYDVGPVKGASNPDIKCGLSPVTNAALQAPVAAGSTVNALWVGQGGGKWIHEVGPVMVYMAECTGTKDCSTFDPAGARWFKVDQKGLKDDGTTWYMADLFNGDPVPFTIPATLKAGNYLLRHELIALHNALTVGGAEFYPNCAQLSVSGSGTGVPSSASYVSFPGAYSDTDPGVVVPDIFNPGFVYDFPGGPVATIVSGGSSGSGAAAGNATASSVKASVSATKAASSAPPVRTASPSAVASTAAASKPSSSAAPKPSSTASAKPTSTGRCASRNRNRRRALSPSDNDDSSLVNRSSSSTADDARRARAIRRHARSRLAAASFE